ncbi:16251_t:CDS:2, partial [Funneliformis caledonium]
KLLGQLWTVPGRFLDNSYWANLDRLFVGIEPTGTMPKPLTTNNVGVTNLKDTVAAANMLRTGSEQIHASFKTNQTYGEDINNALRVHNVDSE